MGNLGRTISYLKRNGVKDTYYAVMERIDKSGMDVWQKAYASYSKETYEKELSVAFTNLKQSALSYQPLISILVPAYETDESFLRQMIDSVSRQSYDKWELVLADASPSDKVRRVVDTYSDSRIVYVTVKENKGISDNTNAALKVAKGDYIGLLDHDDLLEEHALLAVANELQNQKVDMVYTDEDKISFDLSTWFEPNFKLDFNLDLLLSNNYICHFTVIRSSLMKVLAFRREYDGAQDYDMFLRTVLAIEENRSDFDGTYCFPGDYLKEHIKHVPYVLYHWRAHSASTADNPESKRYAYDAGREALADFVRKVKWQAKVKDMLHLGFYEIMYEPQMGDVRRDIEYFCHTIIKRGHVIEGPVISGVSVFTGLGSHYSGYLHRAHLRFEVDSAPQSCLVRNPHFSGESGKGRIVYVPQQ